MMNSVGELVINRTRLIGRMAELKKLVEVLGISRKRLSDKVTEFQEKYEFTRLGNSNSDGGSKEPRKAAGFVQGAQQTASGGGGWLDFSDLEMDRYDDFNILSRSLTEISADISEVLSQLGGFVGRVGGDIDEFTKLGHHLQDEITEARMVADRQSIHASLAHPRATPPRCAASPWIWNWSEKIPSFRQQHRAADYAIL